MYTILGQLMISYAEYLMYLSYMSQLDDLICTVWNEQIPRQLTLST